MFLSHPRLSVVREDAPQSSEPLSSWAKAHAAEVAQWPETMIRVSDSRTAMINFPALQQAIEQAMDQQCTTLEWVAEGGSNQVRLFYLFDGI